MKKGPVLMTVAALAVGALGGAWITATLSPADGERATAANGSERMASANLNPDGQLQQLKQERDEALERVRQLEDELANWNRESQLDEKTQAEIQKRREEFRKRHEERMQQRIDTELDSLAAQLGLNSQQRAQLEDLLKNRREKMRQIFMAARQSGQPFDPALIEQQMPTLEQDLSSVLTQDQLQAYQGFEQERQAVQMESAATLRLNSEAVDLGLTEDQKDAVFQAYYYDIAGNTVNGRYDPQDTSALDTQMQQILSPQQYEQWKQSDTHGPWEMALRGSGILR